MNVKQLQQQLRKFLVHPQQPAVKLPKKMTMNLMKSRSCRKCKQGSGAGSRLWSRPWLLLLVLLLLQLLLLLVQVALVGLQQQGLAVDQCHTATLLLRHLLVQCICIRL
jgi:hypothetical protein